jgi:hypothetical protein
MLTTTYSQGDILTRVFQPQQADLSQDAAQFILGVTFSDDDRRRMDELAEKARQGVLTDEERAALDNFEQINNLIGILKSKARRSLKNGQASPAM